MFTEAPSCPWLRNADLKMYIYKNKKNMEKYESPDDKEWL